MKKERRAWYLLPAQKRRKEKRSIPFSTCGSFENSGKCSCAAPVILKILNCPLLGLNLKPSPDAHCNLIAPEPDSPGCSAFNSLTPRSFFCLSLYPSAFFPFFVTHTTTQIDRHAIHLCVFCVRHLALAMLPQFYSRSANPALFDLGRSSEEINALHSRYIDRCEEVSTSVCVCVRTQLPPRVCWGWVVVSQSSALRRLSGPCASSTATLRFPDACEKVLLHAALEPPCCFAFPLWPSLTPHRRRHVRRPWLWTHPTLSCCALP